MGSPLSVGLAAEAIAGTIWELPLKTGNRSPVAENRENEDYEEGRKAGRQEMTNPLFPAFLLS